MNRKTPEDGRDFCRFDTVIDRRNSDSIKYAPSGRSGKPDNLLPLWVADMDFRVPDPVIEALHTRAEHGIFGYGDADDRYFQALSSWFDTHFGFPVDRRWVVQTPGVVFALSAAIRAFTEKGDSVLLNRPVYYPFSNLIDGLGRRLINSPLTFDGSRYHIDFEDLEEKIVRNDVRLYLLCSPHNPVGRVWTREELKRIGDICLRHGVLVVSDEIHCDFVWSSHPHTVFASLGEEYSRNCIVCTAPSKTFNLAGLCASNIIIPDRDLRKAFRKCVSDTGVSGVNVMALAACRAAYEEGLPWLEELRKYTFGKHRFYRPLPQRKRISDPPDPSGRNLSPLAGYERSRPLRRRSGTARHGKSRTLAGRRNHVRAGRYGISAHKYRLSPLRPGRGAAASLQRCSRHLFRTLNLPPAESPDPESHHSGSGANQVQNFETRRLRLREMPCLLFTVQDLYSSSGFFIRTVVFAGTEDVTKALPPMVLPSPITVVPPRIDAPE